MMSQELWIDTRLNEKEMNFLNHAIFESDKIPYNSDLAGNISLSEQIIDKDNWFYETALKKLTERMFYQDWDNYCKYVVDQEKLLPKFELREIWVNYMKQHEFNPIHKHGGLYSFVIFMKIPTHWKDQHALSISIHSNSPFASDFQFVWPERGQEFCETTNFQLCPEDEGRILFFPAYLQHQVFPFYGTEEERITISGIIVQENSNKLEIPVDVYEEKKNNLMLLEKSVEMIKEEMKQMKKVEGNDS